jgi:hypothetical protein
MLAMQLHCRVAPRCGAAQEDSHASRRGAAAAPARCAQPAAGAAPRVSQLVCRAPASLFAAAARPGRAQSRALTTTRAASAAAVQV